MSSKRLTGGAKTFVDEGTHDSVLDAKVAAKFAVIYKKERKRLLEKKKRSQYLPQ
jgi:hypothetical protein